ncbi:winged helix-turn-helix transcriptional regulator [Ruminococcus sp.]
MKLNETTQSKIDEKVIQLSEKNKELLDVLTNIPEVSQSMIAKELNWDVNTVKYYTKKLKKMGILERTGSSRKGSWIVKK